MSQNPDASPFAQSWSALVHKSAEKSFLKSMTCDAPVLEPSPKHAEIDVSSFVSY